MAATVVPSSSFTLAPLSKRSLIGGGPSSPLEQQKPVKDHQILIVTVRAQSQMMKLGQRSPL